MASNLDKLRELEGGSKSSSSAITTTPQRSGSSALDAVRGAGGISLVQPKSETMNNLLGADAAYMPETMDDARKLQKENPTVWGRISKELMKPVGLVATLAEETGHALGSAMIGDFKGAGSELVGVPAKLGGILTGTRTRSFTDIWLENGADLGIDPRISTAVGLITDIAADPLNFIGGGLTKVGKVTEKAAALTKAGQTISKSSKLYKQAQALGLADDLTKIALAPTKAEQVMAGQRAALTLMANTRWEKTLVGGARFYEFTNAAKGAIKQTHAANLIGKVFSTKTADEGFNLVKNHFDNLMEYRRGLVMDEAMDIQKSVASLSADDARKIVDTIETAGGKKISAIDDVTEIARRLQDNLDTINQTEKKLGLRVTDIQDYFPHIKVKMDQELTAWQKIKNLFKDANDVPTFERTGKEFATSKDYSTKLNAAKMRKYEGTISEIKANFGIDFEGRAAVAYAQRALGSAKAVTSKEFFDSVGQFGAKLDDATKANWIPAKGVKELEGMKFAPDVARQIESYKEAIRPEWVEKALHKFDAVQNWWKAQALVAPSYHTRNMAGNTWNNFLAGVVDPKVYMDAGRVQMGKAVQFTDDAGRIWDNNMLMKAAKQTGVINEGWYAKDIATQLSSELGGLSYNPLRQNFALFRGNRAVGSAFENNARLAHFIQRIKEGSTIDDAALSVKKYLFDYGDLTGVEKELFKRVVPFYTWTRKNIPLQFEQMLKQPGKFAAIPKTTQAIESNVEQPNEKYLGDYIRDNIGVRVGNDDQGNTYYFLLGSWLPAAQAIDFLSQPGENFMLSVSPFFKTPVELWANKSFFFEDSFGQPSQIERYPEENQSFLGLTMRKKTANILKNIRILNELDKLNPGSIFGDKDSPSLINRIAPEAGVRLPLGVGTITTSDRRGGRFTPETEQTSRVLQSLFGKAIPYNPSYAKKFYLWDTETKVRELERAIKDAQRDGQKEYAKRLHEELVKVKKER